MRIGYDIKVLKTHHTAVAIISPAAFWSPIQAIRARYDRHYRRWLPHINLLYPFVATTEFAAVNAKLAVACAKLSPFKIAFNQFKFFAHNSRSFTIWLAPTPIEPLIELQAVLTDQVPGCDDLQRKGNGFTPHLSVAQCQQRDQVNSLIAEWQRDWQPLQFTVDQITIIRRNDPPADIFRVVQQIPLGSAR